MTLVWPFSRVEPMVDQEDIIALTKHVRSFSDALNNLRNSFKESCVDGVYNHEECQRQTHEQLGSVLKILQGVLAKYPLLHSPDILAAARVIITMMKTYNYVDGVEVSGGYIYIFRSFHLFRCSLVTCQKQQYSKTCCFCQDLHESCRI